MTLQCLADSELYQAQLMKDRERKKREHEAQREKMSKKAVTRISVKERLTPYYIFDPIFVILLIPSSLIIFIPCLSNGPNCKEAFFASLPHLNAI